MNYVTEILGLGAVLIYKHEISSWQDEEVEYIRNHELKISYGQCLGGICSYKFMEEYTKI